MPWQHRGNFLSFNCVRDDDDDRGGGGGGGGG